ncbi:MAG TPA: MFS transporter [Stellaceae bacterium]|jgi:MFS family permease|nr:MFS transporter [Stellaceae bacterium]
MSDSASAAVSRGRPSAWTPLAIPMFRAVWLASVASNIGIWLGNVGTAWLMTELRPTPIMVTLVQAATSLPVFLFALPAGAIGDVVDRRRLLIVLQIASMAVAILLGSSTLFGWTTPAVILIASFLFGTMLAFGMPVFQAIVPDLVPRHELAPAVSLNSIGINVARVIGPAVGGVLILGLGVAAPFFINSICYLVVVAMLLRWLPRMPRAQRDAGRMIEAVIEGLRHTLGVAATRATLIRSAGYAFCASVYFALLPLVARDLISGGAGIYGLLLGCLGAGGITMVVLLPHLRARYTPDRIARIGSVISALLLAALGGCRSLWSVVPVLLASGAAWVAVVATVNVAAQVALPSWVRARGLSIFMIVFNGMMAVGSAVWGLVASLVGIPWALVATAGCLAVFDLLTLRWRIPGDDSAAGKA